MPREKTKKKHYKNIGSKHEVNINIENDEILDCLIPTSDIKSLQKEELCQATVYTWGTAPRKHNLSGGIRSKLYGGNVGHAAIKLRFPVDERGDDLIKKYLDSQKIYKVVSIANEPNEKDMKKGTVYLLKNELNDKENNTFNYCFLSDGVKKKYTHELNDKSEKNRQLHIVQEIFSKNGFIQMSQKLKYQKISDKYYEVYFSVFPASGVSSLYLGDFASDLFSENDGVEMNYDRNGKGYLKREKLKDYYLRNWTMKSKFSLLQLFGKFNRKITLAPLFRYNSNFTVNLSKYRKQYGENKFIELKKIINELRKTTIEETNII
jgi:hypothetical protein